MAEKKVIELEVQDNTQNLKKRFAEAKKELQAMAAAYGENSTQAIQAAKKAAELKDIIDDSAEAIKNLQGGGTFKALSTSLGSVASGFGAVQGAVNLLGVESGQVEQALLKVQSAMALAEGLRGLEDAGRAFGALKSTVTDAFKNMSNASKAFIATGIGLIITAIATAIAYSDELGEMWDSLTGRSSDLRIAQEALNETLGDYNKGAQEAITKVNKVGVSFDLAKKGVISKEEALKTYNETLGDSLGKADSYNEAEKLFRDKTDAYIKATALRSQANALLQKAAEEQANSLTASMEDQTTFADKFEIGVKNMFGGYDGVAKDYYKKQKERAKEQEALSKKRSGIFENEAKKLLEQAETLDKANNIESESDNKRTANAKTNTDQRKNDLDVLAKFEQEIHDKRLSQWEQEILAVQRKYDEQIKIAKKYGKDLTVLEEGLQAEIQLINNKYVAEEKEAIDQLRISKQQQANEQIAIDMQKNTAILEANKKRIEEEKAYEQQQLELKKQVEKAKLSFVTDGLNLISEISDLFSAKNEKQARRDFALKKALGITQATISAIEGTQNAFTTASASPITTVFPAYPFIQAGVAGAFGAVKVASIAKQQFGGSTSISSTSGGGGASTSTTGVTTSNPTFNIVGGASTNPLANLAPFKAYVVSGEVTTAQELERNIIQKSVL